MLPSGIRKIAAIVADQHRREAHGRATCACDLSRDSRHGFLKKYRAIHKHGARATIHERPVMLPPSRPIEKIAACEPKLGISSSAVVPELTSGHRAVLN